MTMYLDSSVVLRVLLGQPKPLAGWGRWDAAYSSVLLGVEARRVIDRLRVAAQLDDQGIEAASETLRRMERSIGSIPLSRPVLHRAGLPMPTSAKTLDALHLASALLLHERRDAPVIFATHDPQQARAARALGFETVGT